MADLPDVPPNNRRLRLDQRATLRGSTGSSTLIVAPGRGRILQAVVSGESAFWNSPDVKEEWNVGGDRVWLAPEASWFWKTRETPDFELYEIPAALDPGRWRHLRLDSRSCEVGQRVKLRHQDSGESFAINVRRAFSIVDLVADDRCVDTIAYRTDESLDVIDGQDGQVVGLWSIVQVPIGGTAHVATSAEPQLRTCFGEIPGSAWSLKDRRIKVDLHGGTIFKVGLLPPMVTGRWVYVRTVDDGYVVVARRFSPQPWRLYADAPLGLLETQGDAVQLYNGDGSNGAFAEVETHSPGVIVGDGPARIVESCLTVVAAISRAGIEDWLDEWLNGTGPAVLIADASGRR